MTKEEYDEWFDVKPEGAVERLLYVADFILAKFQHIVLKQPSRAWPKEEKGMLIELTALLDVCAEQTECSVRANTPGNDIRKTAVAAIKVAQAAKTWATEHMEHRDSSETYNIAREKHAASFKTEPIFEFTDEDLRAIQEQLNEIRDLISATSELPDEHKYRLLKRIEAAQRELHKTMSNVDRIMGIILETGIVVRQFGEDLEPLMARAKDLLHIVWGAQLILYGLPPGTMGMPLLPAAEKTVED